MSDIRFTRFGAENYCLFRERIDIEVKNGINFIVGPNGSGKTSALEIPLITLYGEMSDGKKINDVINNKSGKNCFTYVEFDIIDDDGTETSYSCERYGNYKSYGNTVVLRVKGEKPYKKGQREVVPEINRLISSKSLLLNTVIFPQQPKGLFLDLQDSDRKEILRKIQNLDKYEYYRKIAADKEKQIERNINENTNKYNTQLEILEDLRNTYEELKRKKENFDKNKKEEIKNIKEEISQLEKEIKEKEKEFNNYSDQNYNEKYKEITTKISNLESRVSSIQKEEEQEKEKVTNNKDNKESEFDSYYNKSLYSLKEQYNNEIEEIKEEGRNKIEEVNKEKEKYDNEINYQIDGEINKKQEDISEIEKWVNTYRESLEKEYSVCPECKQEVAKDHIHGKIEEKNKEINALNDEIEELQNKKKEKNNRINQLDEKIQELKNHYNTQIENKKKELNNKIKDLDDRLQKAKDKLKQDTDKKISEIENTYKQEKENLQTELGHKKQELSNIEENISTRDKIKQELDSKKNNVEIKRGNLTTKENETFDDSQLKDVKKRITSVKRKLDDIQVEINNLNNKLEKVSFWKEAFSNTGIPSMLMDDAIPFINKRVKEYLDLLSDNRYLISFDTQKETKKGEMRDKISVNVYDNETGANVKNQLSGGQNRLLDIATILTLGDLQQEMQNVRFNMMIADEILDSLDEENIKYVINALRQIAKNKSLFIISHHHHDHMEPDQTLEFLS